MKEEENDNKVNKENKNLPVVQKNDRWRQFRKKMQKSIYMALSVFGIVFPYVDQAADMMKEPPPAPPPINEVMKENMEAKYEQALHDIGVTIKAPEDIDIPDDPPQEEYDNEYKGEDPKIEFKIGDGGDDSGIEFYKKLRGNVEDDVALYRKYREKALKTKDNKSEDTKVKTTNEDKKITNEHDVI